MPPAVLPLAAEGNFLVTPDVGLMIWTLLAFGISFMILRKAAFPRIVDALDKRRRAIEESIDHAERTKQEADQLLEEYRARLREAREQADDITARAQKAAAHREEQAKVDAKKHRDWLMESTRKDIQTETRRALDDIRREVADLTVLATEKVTRKTLDDDDHRRLIEDALSEVDFSQLAGDEGNGKR
ncbi:MAG: F0F1 ATP synthase subunit B [Actinomycetota bacterium]|nr:F0F1 ATP synthase subunit B [Actinomycetota bacterium]